MDNSTEQEQPEFEPFNRTLEYDLSALTNNHDPEAQVPTNWMISSDLELPDWPTGDIAADAHETCPIFSSGFVDNWSHSGFSIKEKTRPHPLPTITPAAECPPGNSEAATSSYITLSTSNDTLSSGFRVEDEGSDVAQEISYSDDSLSPGTRTSGSISQTQNSAELKISREVKSTRDKYRIKQEDRETTSLPKRSKRRQLRDIKAKSATGHATKDSTGATDKLSDRRTSHNMVEKDYRTRLKKHFSDLLDAIPDRLIEGKMKDGEGGRQVSKAEVLTLARTYIQTLERIVRSLEEEKKEKAEAFDCLQRAIVNIRRGPLP